jgi:cysteine-rich repeat protein
VNDGSYGRCAPGCRYAPHCGDGIVQLGLEECDDGNTDETDTCSNACRSMLWLPAI